jgi:hypothetical protein
MPAVPLPGTAFRYEKAHFFQLLTSGLLELVYILFA